MDIKSFLAPGDAVVDIRAADKTRLLTELCNRAAASLQLDAGTVSGDIPEA